MGIKGIYNHLDGSRVSLARLQADSLEQTGRPLRIAVDFALWQFQSAAARGGVNPGVRTLFYRLIRLLGLGVQPIFVFDGDQKPEFKRGKRSRFRGTVADVGVGLGKELIRLFGFRVHQAPGEAEAECALLQQAGLVDAVLSEDADTIMFGCTVTLRDWSSEKRTHVGTPTHVTAHRVDPATGLISGLSREGLVLIAMLSGGDYDMDGVAGFGIEIACRAARAGFGESLCQIRAASPAGSHFAAWRRQLAHELHTNESSFFRCRHSTLRLPSSFPDVQILHCYTHPVVSDRAAVEQLRGRLRWERAPNVAGLRAFLAHRLDWTTRGASLKFIHLMAPGMLAHRLLVAAPAVAETEALIHKIGLQRTHSSADGAPELRVAYIPTELVPIGLEPPEPAGGEAEAEEEKPLPWGRTGLAISGGEESDSDLGYLSDVPAADESAATGVPAGFDPDQPALVWVLKTTLRIGAPAALRQWEVGLARKGARTSGKAGKKNKKEVPEAGAMLKYVTVSKKIRPSSPTKGRKTVKATEDEVEEDELAEVVDPPIRRQRKISTPLLGDDTEHEEKVKPTGIRRRPTRQILSDDDDGEELANSEQREKKSPGRRQKTSTALPEGHRELQLPGAKHEEVKTTRQRRKLVETTVEDENDKAQTAIDAARDEMKRREGRPKAASKAIPDDEGNVAGAEREEETRSKGQRKAVLKATIPEDHEVLADAEQEEEMANPSPPAIKIDRRRKAVDTQTSLLARVKALGGTGPGPMPPLLSSRPKAAPKRRPAASVAAAASPSKQTTLADFLRPRVPAADNGSAAAYNPSSTARNPDPVGTAAAAAASSGLSLPTARAEPDLELWTRAGGPGPASPPVCAPPSGTALKRDSTTSKQQRSRARARAAVPKNQMSILQFTSATKSRSSLGHDQSPSGDDPKGALFSQPKPGVGPLSWSSSDTLGVAFAA